MRRNARFARTILIRVRFVCSSMADAFTHWSYLGNFSERPPFFPEVDDHSTSPFLGFLDRLLNSEYEIRPACADIGSENVAAIALRRG